jgi:hypothetical protein
MKNWYPTASTTTTEEKKNKMIDTESAFVSA